MPWDETATAGSAGDATDSNAPPPGPDPDSGSNAAQPQVVQYALHDAWVVVADGEYDMETITPLAQALTAAAVDHPKVVLDTSGVTFADSTFLNTLLLVHQTTDLHLTAPGVQLRRLLEVTGTNAVLQVHATMAEATA